MQTSDRAGPTSSTVSRSPSQKVSELRRYRRSKQTTPEGSGLGRRSQQIRQTAPERKDMFHPGVLARVWRHRDEELALQREAAVAQDSPSLSEKRGPTRLHMLTARYYISKIALPVAATFVLAHWSSL